MPRLTRYGGFNHARFITTSTYRRAPLFESDLLKQLFVRVLGEVRDDLGFKLFGYVVMPDHFHLLLWPSAATNPSAILQSVKVRTAMRVLAALRHRPADLWCDRMLSRLRLPETVHAPATHRVWQRRFYDMNIWSEVKVIEKLNYMHANPVKRGLVETPDRWPWSSYGHYHLSDTPVLAIDRLP